MGGLLEEAEARLQNSLEKKDDLISTNRDNYRDKVREYLEHWEAFSQFKGKGIPESCHKQITDSLKKHFFPFILYGIKDLLLKGTPPMDSLLKSQLSVMTTYRHKPPVSSPNWNAWTEELFLRQDEVSHQKHILSLGFEQMYKLCKMDIFPKDEDGNWISPSRLKMAEALIERMKESPQPPPLRKRRRDPSDQIIQAQEQEPNFNSPRAKKGLFRDTLSEDKSEEKKSPEAPPARKRKIERSEITEPQEEESNFKSSQMRKNLFFDTLS